jgi:hypothetical protein
MPFGLGYGEVSRSHQISMKILMSVIQSDAEGLALHTWILENTKYKGG